MRGEGGAWTFSGTRQSMLETFFADVTLHLCCIYISAEIKPLKLLQAEDFKFSGLTSGK